MTKAQQIALAGMIHRGLSKLHVLGSEAAELGKILDAVATLNNALVEEHGNETDNGGSGVSAAATAGADAE